MRQERREGPGCRRAGAQRVSDQSDESRDLDELSLTAGVCLRMSSRRGEMVLGAVGISIDAGHYCEQRVGDWIHGVLS